MTPSETIVQGNPAPVGDENELDSLIAACGRDERPALEALFKLTAPMLYGLAIAATSNRGQAEQALVQTYLSVFAEAEQFDGKATEPTAWLQGMLGRHLPAIPEVERTRAASGEPVEPPAELWQKLDIALGLKRLDRHIKPGVATQARGRDPMPNAYDRRIERQLRFWRVAGVSSFLAFALAAAFIGAVALQGGPLNPLESNAASLAEVSAAVPPAEPARLAILRAADEGRVWRVDLEGETLRVRSLPPFTRPDGGSRPGVLALWLVTGMPTGVTMAAPPATGGDVDAEPGAGAKRTLVRLADLDPATTTGITLPDGLVAADLEQGGVELVISLEPIGAASMAAPTGPVLFSGGLEP
jgi:hypothetical protein